MPRDARPPDHEQARQGPRQPPVEHGPQRDGGGETSGAEARNWAAGAHLSAFVGLLGVPPLIGPLVVWLVKREEDAFVADQSLEALNFQISVLLYAVLGAIAAVALALVTLGVGLFVIVPVVAIFVVGVLLLPILAAVRASEGERYRYPLTLRILQASGR